MTEKGYAQLHQRFLVSLCAIAAVVIAIFFSQHYFFRPVFALFVSGMAGVALWEYFQLAFKRTYEPKANQAIVWGVAYIMAVFMATQDELLYYAPKVVLLLAFFSIFAYFLVSGKKPIASTAITLFGFAYIAVTLGCMVDIVYFFPLEGFEDGRCWLIYLLTVTKVSDIAAYFVGQRWGKRKLAQHLSPGKTVEGGIAAVVGALATSIIFYIAFNNDAPDTAFSLNFSESIRLGLMIGVIGQIGDLAESLLKRDAGVKDSNTLPGLGGILDMLDSLLFTAPLVFIFLLIR